MIGGCFLVELVPHRVVLEPANRRFSSTVVDLSYHTTVSWIFADSVCRSRTETHFRT
jgi:hypothetical protein